VPFKRRFFLLSGSAETRPSGWFPTRSASLKNPSHKARFFGFSSGRNLFGIEESPCPNVRGENFAFPTNGRFRLVGIPLRRWIEKLFERGDCILDRIHPL
jgi:hypothetical protein